MIARPGAAEVTVRLKSFYPSAPTRASLAGYVEADGYVSIEAAHYTRKVARGTLAWEKIEDLGRTLSSMTIVPAYAATAALQPTYESFDAHERPNPQTLAP
jgi:hypothetical protein